ncbi:RNA ligase family protein [Paenibacillus sp. HWE-109]|uniref:RNA ligase family protein n=1 Tax=Paenibacillus sp. HWE-109 TaxID=1306526 RepID=UPI001EDF7C3F|nr:RNA ligase family protein [Paenibacillus sp. HWE-109]UKS30197.1 RNA ligase family protein [Paenibacillus sp. HWE-109]
MGEEMRKYSDIARLGHKLTAGVVREGDYVTVYEKLDGANASFKREGNEVIAFSRNTQLSPENNLRGFYEWTRGIDPERLMEDVIYYGEWLVRHKVDYGANAGGFYLFDIYEGSIEDSYAPTDFVIAEAARLGLMIAPILYAGPYRSYEHLASLVGRSALATSANSGEGIVVKNVSFRDQYGKQLFVKLVSDGFREMQPQKAPRDPNAQSAESAFVKTFLTRARVEKLLYKLVDEGVIPESFGLEDMGDILRELGSRVYDDLIKEEADSLPQDYEVKALRQSIGKTLPYEVKSIILEKEAIV